ncbi:ANTAR domain-containing response regulator [Solimonas soli]|uniref:ANTAR domain-containing response regulator n=1 Tax=Solimonas soli TaxID=413479 RepID=UPI00146FB501|nr:ANTAR domain-containing protein [Solimonas soli]
MSTRVLIAGAAAAYRPRLCAALEQAGCVVLPAPEPIVDLEALVQDLAPDLILIHAESPDRDTLENLAVFHERAPKPVIALCARAGSALSEQIDRAGFSFYAVDELSPALLQSLVQVSLAQFQREQTLRESLAQAQAELGDRRDVDRAKCLLMERYGMKESEAYHHLRRAAMRRAQKLPDFARTMLRDESQLDHFAAEMARAARQA